MENGIPRLSRLAALLTLLQSKRIVTAGFLAEKFGVSVRTVYRDIRALEDAGVPVVTEEGRGYSLADGYTLPPVMFSEAEANALITAEQWIVKNKDASLARNYTEAVAKIKSVLKYSTKEKVDLLSKRIFFRTNPGQETTSDLLADIQAAITDFKVLVLDYRSETGGRTERIVEPLALYSTHENWILIAHCRLRKEKRAFRLDRIEKLDVPGETFPAYPFSLRQYFEECEKNSQNP